MGGTQPTLWAKLQMYCGVVRLYHDGILFAHLIMFYLK